ncbi:MAG: LemA family protein [Clostridia bacterium]|nr:LemA family protein [Clostridia bacterium]
MNLLATLGTGAIAAIAIIAVLLLLVVFFICWFIGARNGFVRLKNNCEEAFSTIDVYLKKRYDLIPNVVETVKGYVKHESETLENIVKARNQAACATTPDEKIAADASVTRAIRSINIVAEQYPDLKANASFLDLSAQLKSIESQLAEQRKYYNAMVKRLNTEKDIFPKSIAARSMHIEKMSYFQLDSEEERKNITIKF